MQNSNRSENIFVGTENTTRKSKSVTVIGLGPMGQAMAAALLEHGYKVTVWNRTSSKADELVTKGAVKASTIHEALAVNELIILSLTDYDAMYAILEPASEHLSGKVLVNLSSDTPKKSREAAKWLADHGAGHLTGGVQVPPSGIGKPESSTYYSGPKELFEAHKETLEVLTGTDYRGEDPGLAALYYQIGMDMFWTSMLSYLHASAVAQANGITAEQFLPYASETMSTLPKFIEFYTPRINAGEYPGDVDRLAMGLASVEHVIHTTQDAGIDITLPTAVLEVFRRGMEYGHAGNSFTSLIEIFKNSEIRP
ncbi:NAD(P)-dependent oxidoreductase [Paenibacillus harenae]|uniref:NAD(P)-dependent oxidoreductase n=1 Tax=Paenibacillus harenae TaxID=306543 RepID=UPI00278F5C9B|nr:NAD(P)-binding domain-containing protein [Paenibacillus harenae]MDQ0060471.1 3-hydroxyisobutyrate dehydrogenase-like beta-hydroxyacid dehydrogenase [Paenibacillus harenae]